MKETKNYWKGLEELREDESFVAQRDKEFPEYLPINESGDGTSAEDGSRRDFLKLMGFGIAAASLAACEAPVRKAVPYVKKPVNVDPGKANYYASTVFDGENYASVLVKTREGRPIHVEGNALSTVNGKGTNPQVSASLLNLYDSSRLKSFQKKGADISKSAADKEIIAALKASQNIRIVSNTIISPSTKQVIADFVAAYPGTKHVQYDPISFSALREANGGLIPSYKFDQAKTIVSFSADFLSTWLSPIEFAGQYAKNRKLKKGVSEMSRHYQFETALSLTGSNADYRTPVKPSEEAGYVVELYNQIAKATGASTYKSGVSKVDKSIASAAKDLLATKGASIVVSSSNDVAVQTIVAKINELLGNNGATLDFDAPCNLKQGNDTDLTTFASDVKAGSVDAVIFYGANPAYDSAVASELTSSLSKVKTKISFADRVDETASLVDYICSDLNSFESWGDAEPYVGNFSLIQPTITPIFKGIRSAQESLLTWSGNTTSYLDYVKSYWKTNFFSSDSSQVIFSSFWDKVLQDGVYVGKTATVVETTATEEGVEEEVVESNGMSVDSAAARIVKTYKSTGGLELVLTVNNTMGNGGYANNVWLHELPDPVSKVCWDNYLALSAADATALKLNEFDVAKVEVGGAIVQVPVLVQPGQAKGTGAIALGYGRTKAGNVTEKLKSKDDSFIKNATGVNASGENAIGANVYPFAKVINGNVSFVVGDANVTNAGTTHQLARTQTHQTIMARAVVQEATLAEYKASPDAGRVYPLIHTSKGAQKPNEVDIWAAPASSTKAEYEENKKNGVSEEVVTHVHPNHHWGLVIDLNSCIGCSACTVSCHVENNVPVVGKDEVLRKRDMHWLRIDRYYASQPELDADNKTDAKKAGYQALETPAYNPEVVFQPMMCQHCNHAPCETVCPVAATTHSSEGLNQMAYNRCIGTRYCANNCPFKVRRFNWFNYSDNGVSDREFGAVNTPSNDDLGKMVLNPDVTVRARGVMEKCSMCVQRIQAGKLEAKANGRKVQDGDVVTACASVCPTEAIVFGDMNDPKSRISQVMTEENKDRNFQVLEEINVKPNVSYLTKIRNKA